MLLIKVIGTILLFLLIGDFIATFLIFTFYDLPAQYWQKLLTNLRQQFKVI